LLILYFEYCYKSVQNEIQIRAYKKHINNEFLSDFQLDEYHYLIEKQRLFLIYCTDHNFQYAFLLNLFRDNQNKIEIVVFLFNNHEFQLVSDILIHFNLVITKVAYRIIDSLDPEQFSSEYIMNLKKFCNVILFKQIMSSILSQICSQHHQKQRALLILNNLQSDFHFKISLLIQFSQLEQALQLSVQNNIFDLIPLIGYYSTKIMNSQIAERCVKNLEKEKS
jgi:hypothetical protein